MKFYEKNKSTYCGFLLFLNWFHEYFLQATEAHIFYWKKCKKDIITYLYVKCILFIEYTANIFININIIVVFVHVKFAGPL